jgi:hypothetical protein
MHSTHFSPVVFYRMITMAELQNNFKEILLNKRMQYFNLSLSSSLLSTACLYRRKLFFVIIKMKLYFKA